MISETKKNVSVRIYSEIEELIPNGDACREDCRKGCENVEDSEKSIMTTLSDGVLSRENGRVRLEYTDNDGDPGGGLIKTTIEFEEATPGIILVIREGELNSSMLFEVGKKHDAVYRTGELDARLAVTAKRTENDLLGSGRLYLDYVLSLDPLGRAGERARLTIDVSEMRAPKVFGEYDGE